MAKPAEAPKEEAEPAEKPKGKAVPAANHRSQQPHILEDWGRRDVFFVQDDIHLQTEPKDLDFNLHVHSESKDFDVKVVKFTCQQDLQVGCMMAGKGGLKWNWTFKMGAVKQDWEIEVKKGGCGFHTFQLTVDDKEVFNNKLREDFEYNLNVCGILKLNRQYEVNSMGSTGDWYPATLKARGDGKYEAQVLIPPDEYERTRGTGREAGYSFPGDEYEVTYPIVELSRIRDPFTKKEVEIPSNMIRLEVKKDSALSPKLTINGDSFTSYICVPTPAAEKPPAEIKFTVNKDRTIVTSPDVGHGTLKEALDATRYENKVRSKGCQKTKLKCQWEILIGAFGEHLVVAEKTSMLSKEVNVSIDGKLVVGGAGGGLSINGKEWCTNVAIQGSVALLYKLHKSSINGAATDETTTVTEQIFHSNMIRIHCPDHKNLESATLECDGVEFSRLEMYKARVKEPLINDEIETFERTHGISVPYAFDKVHDPFADLDDIVPGASHVLHVAHKEAEQRGLVPKEGGLLPIFSCCTRSIDDSHVLVVPGNADEVIPIAAKSKLEKADIVEKPDSAEKPDSLEKPDKTNNPDETDKLDQLDKVLSRQNSPVA